MPKIVSHDRPDFGLILMGVSLLAFTTAIAGFTVSHPGIGMPALIVALATIGAGMAALNAEGRRQRSERHLLVPPSDDGHQSVPNNSSQLPSGSAT